MTDDRRTFFDVFGPFEPCCAGRKTESAQALFWQEVNGRCDGLSAAIGCYMFCVDNGKSIRPWYVGMTVSQKGFAGEVFQPHKRLIYNEVLEGRRGKPIIFLFPLMTPESRFSTAGKTARPIIKWLEHYLMTAAFARNAEIGNVKGMTYLRQVEVLGLLGKRPGRPHLEVQAVRKALFGVTSRPSDS